MSSLLTSLQSESLSNNEQNYTYDFYDIFLVSHPEIVDCRFLSIDGIYNYYENDFKKLVP